MTATMSICQQNLVLYGFMTEIPISLLAFSRGPVADSRVMAPSSIFKTSNDGLSLSQVLDFSSFHLMPLTQPGKDVLTHVTKLGSPG